MKTRERTGSTGARSYLRRHHVGNRKSVVISLALVSIILVSYVGVTYYSNNIQPAAYATSDQKANSVNATLVSGNTQFAFNLFTELVNEEGNKNIFISPLSVSIALAMAYNGAGGTTRDAMAKTLNFGSKTLEEINQEYSNLIQSVENVDQQVQMLIGNSVWMRQEFEPLVKPSFLQSLGTSYDSEMFARDFGNPQTVSDINNWANQKTEGKIKQIIQNLSPDQVMLLINAIYFKGTWITSFDQNETQKQDFYLQDGSTVKVDMMSTMGTFSYYGDGNCQVARLPYGRDKIAMYVFLPNEGISLDSFIANLNQTTQNKYISSLHSVANLLLELPKFKMEYSANLNKALVNLGMGIAFDPSQANFSGIAPSSLFISSVDHKATVEINEEGTVAAAITKITMSYGSSSSSGPPPFIVNRPFFFEIRDDRSGSILFMGKILNPAET